MVSLYGVLGGRLCRNAPAFGCSFFTETGLASGVFVGSERFFGSVNVGALPIADTYAGVGLVLGLECSTAQASAYLITRRPGCFLGGKLGPELVAADMVSLAACLFRFVLNYPCNLAQGRVAGGVAHGVVDLLEIVCVHGDLHGHALTFLVSTAIRDTRDFIREQRLLAFLGRHIGHLLAIGRI